MTKLPRYKKSSYGVPAPTSGIQFTVHPRIPQEKIFARAEEKPMWKNEDRYSAWPTIHRVTAAFFCVIVAWAMVFGVAVLFLKVIQWAMN